ncbi:MAG: DUF2953 domain-containing protein [Oscillospiraceae bacterium]|nr:DUF2953 domain-containing protein [Oscillospiraceae bacterium]
MTALYITLIILAVIMLLLIIPADCVIDISYNDKMDGGIFIKYAFVRLKIFPTEKEKEEIEEDVKEGEKDAKEDARKGEKKIKDILRLVKAVYEELRHDIFDLIAHLFCKTIRIKELNISSRFGIGDPMYTGIAIGGANTIVYNVISTVDRHMQLDKWNVSLNADFDNLCVSAGVYCKIRTRGIYILKLGMMAAILLLKIMKISRRIKSNG